MDECLEVLAAASLCARLTGNSKEPVVVERGVGPGAVSSFLPGRGADEEVDDNDAVTVEETKLTERRTTTARMESLGLWLLESKIPSGFSE